MTMMVVAPQELVTMLRERGIDLRILRDIGDMRDVLSVHDMAEMHLSRQDFPFAFDKDLGIMLVDSPLGMLAEEKDDESMYNRVNERIETLKLRRMAEESKTSVCTLYSVDETLWVAALQRQPCGKVDPDKAVVRQNHRFFDDMMNLSLHNHPFERVCSTNLFTYYLRSMPKLAA